MKYNQLGKSNLFVSELSLGCMSLPKDKKTSQEIIDQAIDDGINYLDTADLYDFGYNEEMVGDAIKDKQRDKIILASKVGNHFDPKTKKWFWDPSPNYIKSAIEASLKRLKTDYLDFYLLHGGTIEDPIDDVIETFEKLQAEGKIRAYGISSIRPNVIKEYVQKASIAAVMMQYSILDRRLEEDIAPLLKQNNIGILARGSIAKGLLTKDYPNALTNKAENGYLDYTNQELADLLHSLHSLLKNEADLLPLALQYGLNNKAVASLVLGTSHVNQLKEQIDAYKQPHFENQIIETIKQIAKANKYNAHR